MSEHNRAAAGTAGNRRSGAAADSSKRNRPGTAAGKPVPSGRSQAKSGAEEAKEGDRIVVTIKRIGINGEGVGYYRRKAVFIPGAIAGEVVKARVTKVEPSYLQAELTEVEKRSPLRQTPPCPVYEECGGCQLQHIRYEGQLEAKEELVREAFRRYCGRDAIPLRPILGMDEPWGYRNKAQLQAGLQRGKPVTGLYRAGSRELVDITGCPVQHPVINETVREVRDILHELNIPIASGEGAVRTIVARTATASDEVQVTLITTSDRLPRKEQLVAAVRERLPRVITLAQNVNPGSSPLVFGEKTTVLWGRPQLRETLGALRFGLSPRAFFQLNPAQTVKLYDAVAEAAALSGREIVVDAYCGTGTIGLWLAPRAREVRGIELVPEAVDDARRNARENGIANARFYLGRAEKLLPQWVRAGIRPDVVVADPPRTGCGDELLRAILHARPRRFVYVSCNPATLAKDCRVLLDGGYRLEWLQPVDMFPQTTHVECVVSTYFTG